MMALSSKVKSKKRRAPVMDMESRSGLMEGNTKVIGETMSEPVKESLFMLKEMNIMVTGKMTSLTVTVNSSK